MSPPDNPGGEATVPSSSSPSAQAATTPSDTRPCGGVTCHPFFPQGPIEDFDFSYRGNNWPDAGPWAGGNARVPPPGGHVRCAPSDIDTSNDKVLGGRITTPRFTDHSRVARAKNVSRFDLVGLTESKYHIGAMGVSVLTPQIINNCGYQSFHRDHPEDVLLCAIAKLLIFTASSLAAGPIIGHSLVVQWWNTSLKKVCLSFLALPHSRCWMSLNSTTACRKFRCATSFL